MRVLGIDHGHRRVGLALSSEDGGLALPHATLDRGDAAELIEAIREVVETQSVTAIVVGLPLTLDGKEGAAARRARAFAEALEAAVALEVELLDERMTTVAAERSLSEVGVRGKRRRKVVDQVAAALILQTYLDRAREPAWPETDDPNPIDLDPPSGGEGGGRQGRRRRRRPKRGGGGSRGR